MAGTVLIVDDDALVRAGLSMMLAGTDDIRVVAEAADGAEAAPAVDAYGQVQPVPRDVNVTMSAPAGNAAPTASFTVSCNQNVCAFDGRGSTDENAPTLTYSWNFGNGRTGSAMSHTFPAAGTWTVTLTVTDGWGKSASTTRTVNVTAT